MMPVRLEPAVFRSRVKHSTTEPLRSLTVCKGKLEDMKVLKHSSDIGSQCTFQDFSHINYALGSKFDLDFNWVHL